MFIVHLPLADMLKLAAHAEDRLLERTQLDPRIIQEIRDDLRGTEVPYGNHHVVLPDGSYAVIKDVSRKNKRRHVVATVLSPEMRPPGRDLTIDVASSTPKGKSNRRVSAFSQPRRIGFEDFGDRQVAERSKRTSARHANMASRTPSSSRDSSAYAEHTRGKNSESFQETYSSREVKVAAFVEDDATRVANLRYPKETVAEWLDILQQPFRVLELEISELPRHEFPSAGSKEVEAELRAIQEIMSRSPLGEIQLDQATNAPHTLFSEICLDEGLDAHEEITRALSDDLLKIALYLKYVYGRPRPYQIAPYYGVNLGDSDLDPGNPSFPSGHALLGYGLANHYASIYPSIAAKFNAAAKVIALSRLQNGVHFPSDLKYAKALADFVIPPPQTTEKVNRVEMPLPAPAPKPAERAQGKLLSNTRFSNIALKARKASR